MSRGLMDFTKSNAYDGATSSGSTGVKSEWDWGDALNAGAVIVGGLIQDRGAARANQTTQQMSREEILARRQSDRENIAANMQTRQDDYQREVTRGRNAISPYRQMYSGPAFEGVNPDAPIYNPLTEPGHLYQELRKPPTVETTSSDGKPVKKPKKPKKPWWKF